MISKVRSFTATSPLEKRIPGPQKGEDHLPVLWFFIIFQEFLPLNFRGVWEFFEFQRRNLFMKWGETELSLSPLFFTHAMFDFYVVRKEMLYVRCWTPVLEPLKKGIIYPINAHYCHYITCYIGWMFKGFPTIFPMILSNIQQPRGSHPGAPYLWDLANWNPRCHIRSPAFVASALVLHSVWPEAIQTFGESVGKRGSSKKWHQLQNKARFLGGNPKSLKATINSSIVWFPRNGSLLMIPGKQEMTSEYVWCLWRFFGDEDGTLKNQSSWIRKNWEKDFRKSEMFKINKTQQFDAKHLFSGNFWQLPTWRSISLCETLGFWWEMSSRHSVVSYTYRMPGNCSNRLHHRY